jgi:pyruvate/2-oxoglutarate dehydrogenase complex dihydrolipoamide acyltransferase (E2) component
MPALSSTMTEGKVVSWLKAVGDFVEAGDALMVVESDKADMDVESFEEGYLAQIITDEGDSAAVGAPVAVLVESEAEISEVSSGAPAAPAASAVPADGNVDVEVIEMTMPALSSTMTEGKVMSWLVNVGDKVEAGDPVMVVESDKADMDVESFDDGYIAAILTGEGESAPVGAPVALLAKTEAEIGAVSAAGPGGGLPRSKAVETEPAGAASTTTTDKGVNEGRIVASGYAKKLAGERGVDLRTVVGTGPNGRITGDDVEGSPGGAYVHVPAVGVVAATPMAQELAKKNRLDLSTITGTGNFGRVTEDDVLVALGRPPKKATPVPPAAAAPAPAPVSSAKPEPPAARPVAKPAAPPVVPASSTPASSMQDEVVPMNNMKAAVAKNMEATLHVPAFRVSRTIITDNFDALYAVGSIGFIKPKKEKAKSCC